MESSDDKSDMRESRYADEIESKVRMAALATRLRAFGIQLLWVLVIVAGAGVPLNQALGGPNWVGPTLGFVVVVAAGVERIFSRTSSAAVANDVLRRDLAREQRLFAARSGAYADTASPFEVYTARCEEMIAKHDEVMVGHEKTMIRQGE